MLATNFAKKIRYKLSGLISVSMLATLLPAMVLGGLVSSSSAANANLVVNAANATFSFTSKTNIVGNGRANNDVVRFNNVITISGISIDAVVKTTITNTGTSGQNLAIESYDPGTTSGAENFLDLNMDAISGSSFHGYANLNFTFYEAGTYTGVNTGNPVTLQNVSVFSLDIDSTEQFSDFRGFQKYYVNSTSRIRIGNNIPVSMRTTAPFVRFLSGDGAGGTNDPRDSVMVEYLTLTSLDARVGNAAAGGGAYFAIGFGQLDWNGSSAGLGTPNPVNNPVNAAPTSSSTTINIQNTGNFILEERHFGNYADADGNAFSKVVITSLPIFETGTATVQTLSSGTWVNVTSGASINVSAINAGELRIVMNGVDGAATSTLKFRVNDSLANSAAEYTITLNVVPTPQTITFNNPGTRVLNSTVSGSDTATATSNLATVLTSLTTGVCTISSRTIVNTGTAGACTVTATQDGDLTFSAAPSVTQTFYFSSLSSQTITFNQPADQNITAGTYSAVVSASPSNLTVTVTSLTPAICTVSGVTVTLVRTGTCQLRATQGGNNTYAPASPVTRSFTVTGGSSQTIDFSQPTSKVVGQTFASGATATSGLIVTLTSDDTSICTVSGLNIVAVAVGTCVIDANQSGGIVGNNSFSAAPTVSQSFSILSGTAQTITFEQPANKFVGDTFASGATASSTLTVTLFSNDDAICTVSGLMITAVAVGSCEIDASQEGGAVGGTTFAPATTVSRTFTISVRPAPLINVQRIDFDLNSGSGYMNPQYAFSNSIVTLEANLYKRVGYTFSGWNTKSDGSGIAFQDKSRVTVASSDVQLFAQWKLITTKPTITWANPVAIQEGTLLSATQLNALASTAGTYTYLPAATALLAAGKHTLKVTFVPTDPKFETVETTVEIEVLARPRVTWANPAAIQEGTALSATQLNATGSVPGTFSYSPPSGTVLPVGKNILKVTFTPTDTRLTAVTAEVSIDVNAKPVVIPGAPVSPTYSVTGNPKTTITWSAGANATSYVVQVDGRNACSVSTLTCEVARVLGPKNVVNVTSIADGGKTSAAVKAAYAAPASPQVLTVVNFDTARAVIKSAEARKLRAFANQINAAGFTTLTVFGHTDSVGGVDNQKLSIARANSTITFLKRLLPNVKFVRSGFAAGEPVADNSTAEGKAANRRAEVFIP